jgi:hypothetical protein
LFTRLSFRSAQPSKVAQFSVGANSGQAPDDWARFVPWQMDEQQLAAMRAATGIPTIDSS